MLAGVHTFVDVVSFLWCGGVCATDNSHDAVAHGDIDAVADALSRCADVDTPDAHGHTALHICVQYTQLDCAHLVLSANAHVDAPNPRGCTPLHLAAEAGHTGTVVGTH